ncbi:MAG: hypothetical protein LBL55_00195 [Propionibacteriaceae bacterium]|jgi:hypothetical protein|nr:hypothetical protein [Propionibacteriaceae bacterium]
MSERSGPARPEGLGATTAPLTKPVRAAERRPTPRWVGWVLVGLPGLAGIGLWLGPESVTLGVPAVVLGAAAAWDWWRFQDRSRTMRIAYLGLVLLATGAVMVVGRGLPWATAGAELVDLAVATVLSLALVQLYRGGETVLTLVRGWLYLLALLAAVTIYQRLAQPPGSLTGLFQTPGQLALAALAGLSLMPLGHALEHDRRLRWAYPVAAGCAVEILWWSRQPLALGLGLAVIGLWLALGRRSRWVLVGAVVAGGLARASAWSRPWAWSGWDGGPDRASRRQLAEAGFTMLRDSWFLGVGPGGFAQRLPAGLAQAAGPHSPGVELAVEYGLGAVIVVVLAGLGLLHWCFRRLRRTRGQSWTTPERAAAVWCAAMVLVSPLVGTLQPTWLDRPLTGLIIATLALLARHVENPHGRRPAAAVVVHPPVGGEDVVPGGR